jgi:hypothetical protein
MRVNTKQYHTVENTTVNLHITGLNFKNVFAID